jgi:adenylate cyclase
MLRLTLFGGFSAAGTDGTEIRLKSRKAKALLAYLALPLGKSRSREEIMALLWSDRGEAQARASLRQVLTGLRKELGEEAKAALNITDDAISLDPDNVIVANNKAGEELLAGFHLHDPAFEDWLRDERLRLEGTVTSGDQPAGPSLPDKPSIAVLPFTNMSGDPEQEYFSDGITEDIITGLSRFRELFVIARNSSFTYKGRPMKVQDIGEKLGVRYVVEGSVRKAGNRVRITAQLVDVATGNHLWAERYDREMEDVFAIQDEVTETVVATLAGRLGDLGVDYAKRKSTHSLTAFDYVLHARQLIYRYKRESILEARELLEKAIALDPEYAIAHAWLSEAYWAEWLGGWTTNAHASFEQSAHAAAQALALDDTDPQVRIQMGQICLNRRQYDEARFHFDKALSLNPNEPNALMMKSYYSTCVGDPERAVAQINEAIRVDPLGHYGFMEGIAHYTARNYDQAITAFKIVRGEAQSGRAWLAACHAQCGNLRDARAAATEFVARTTKAMADMSVRPPESWREFFAERHPYKHQEDMDHLLDGLTKAGLK